MRYIQQNRMREAEEWANGSAEIQRCPHSPTLGLPGSLTTADMQLDGGNKMKLGCTGQGPGLIHHLLVPSMQDLMQYPACPACRASLICCLFGLEHWWEGPVGIRGWLLPSRVLWWSSGSNQRPMCMVPWSPFPPCAYFSLVPLRTDSPRLL